MLPQVCLDQDVMWTVDLFESPLEGHDRARIRRALIATVLAVAALMTIGMAIPRDPVELVPGVPCAVLQETAISSALGMPMHLTDARGGVCTYVSAVATTRRTLVIEARDDMQPPPQWLTENSIRVEGLGDAALRLDDALYVRYGSRGYTLHINDPGRAFMKEVRLVKMMRPTLLAFDRH